MHPGVVRTAEVAAHHESNRPGELHRETAVQVVGRTGTVDREAGHTEPVGHAAGHMAAAERRMDREVGEAVVRKAKEPAQGRHKAKELGQVVHRRVKELVEGAHMVMAMEHCRAVAGKEIEWVEEDQMAELVEKVLLLHHSRSRMHLSCQSGPRLACRPLVSHPWACHHL